MLNIISGYQVNNPLFIWIISFALFSLAFIFSFKNQKPHFFSLALIIEGTILFLFGLGYVAIVYCIIAFFSYIIIRIHKSIQKIMSM